MVTYLANMFSPLMVSLPANVSFTPINKTAFCNAISDHNVRNTIGHKGTINVVNALCGTNLQPGSPFLNAKNGDIIYIILLGFKADEHRILSLETVAKMYEEGFIALLQVVIYGGTLVDLLKDAMECKGIGNKIEYNYLSDPARHRE